MFSATKEQNNQDVPVVLFFYNVQDLCCSGIILFPVQEKLFWFVRLRHLYR